MVPLSPGYDYKFSVKCDFPRWDPAGPADGAQDGEMQNECSSLGGKIGQSHGKICLGNLQGIFVCWLSLARKSGQFHGPSPTTTTKK